MPVLFEYVGVHDGAQRGDGGYSRQGERRAEAGGVVLRLGAEDEGVSGAAGEGLAGQSEDAGVVLEQVANSLVVRPVEHLAPQAGGGHEVAHEFREQAGGRPAKPGGAGLEVAGLDEDVAAADETACQPAAVGGEALRGACKAAEVV